MTELATYGSNTSRERKFRLSFDALYCSACIALIVSSFGFSFVIFTFFGKFPFAFYRSIADTFLYQAHAYIGFALLGVWTAQIVSGFRRSAPFDRTSLHARMGRAVYLLLFLFLLSSAVQSVYWNLIMEDLTRRTFYGMIGLPLVGIAALIFMTSGVRHAIAGRLKHHRTDMIYALTVTSGVAMTRVVSLTMKLSGLDPLTLEVMPLPAPLDDGVQFEELQLLFSGIATLLLWAVYALRHGLLRRHWVKTAVLLIPVACFPLAFVN